jgi:hypothetical protein
MKVRWLSVKKTDPRAIKLMDEPVPHYSRQKPGTREIGPPGEKLVFITLDYQALWGSHRPAPWTSATRADKFKGHSCFVFRRFPDCDSLASSLIREVVGLTALIWGDAPFITYVGVNHVKSDNPGYCYKKAGFIHIGFKDGTKLGRMARLEMSIDQVKDCRIQLDQPFVGHLPERYKR